MDSRQVWAHGKHQQTVKARSLLCYWAVRKLAISATELSTKLSPSMREYDIVFTHSGLSAACDEFSRAE